MEARKDRIIRLVTLDETVERGTWFPSNKEGERVDKEEATHVACSECGMHKAATEAMLPVADKPTLPMIWERTQLLTEFLDGVILEDITGQRTKAA